MGEILFFYIFTAMVICYFFRKFCEDPQARKEREAQEAAELEAEIEAEKLASHKVNAAINTPMDTEAGMT